MSQALLRAFVLNKIEAEISSLTALTKELQALQLTEELRGLLNDTQAPTSSGKQTIQKTKI